MDPPEPRSGACCDVGDIVGLDDEMRQASPPLVAWDGTEWGVAWTDMPALDVAPARAVFRRLDVDARPVTDVASFGGIDTWLAAMAYGNHRFGVVTSSGYRDERPAGLYVVDRDGALVTSTLLPEGLWGLTVTRHQLVHGWAAMTRTTDEEGDGRTESELVVYDEALRLVAQHRLDAIETDGPGTAIVSLKSALVVASGLGRTILRTYEGYSIDEVDQTEVGFVGTELAATRFRDSVVLAGRNYAVGPLRTMTWDPFARRVSAGPREIATTEGGQGIGLAADDVGGTMGLCYPVGGGTTRDADAVMFVLLDPHGAPLGEPVVVGSGFRYVASCAVGSSSRDTYVVLWWNAAWEPPGRHSILAARVTVRR